MVSHTKYIHGLLLILVLVPLSGCQTALDYQSLPENGQILFVSWQDDNTEIMLASQEEVRRLTTNDTDNGHPVWSPNGKQIAYISGEADNRHLLVMDAEGPNNQILAENVIAKDVAPAWAFDSQMIAFVCLLDQRTSICLVSTTGNWMQIMPGDWASLGSIHWAPNDPIILFHAMSENARDIFTYTTYTNKVRNLTQRDGQDYAPIWAPDGRRIAFISNRNSQSGIYLMNIDGTNSRQILQANVKNGLHWSPDNNQIAFTQASGENHLCIMNISEKTTCCTEREGTYPSWAPDGKHLVFESRRGKTSYLYLMDNHCSSTQRLTPRKTNSFAPTWKP